MFGEKALELVREAARCQDNLIPFNEDLVRQVLEEIRTLWDENCREVAGSSSISSSVTLRHAAIERNKRCLLAYLNDRMEHVRRMRWQFGAVLPDDIKLNMCEPETEFFTRYNKSLAGYMRSVGADLTANLTPPKELYIAVRVMQDYGELETPDGDVVLLKAGTQHHLPRDLCEQLIMQGILQHVTS